MRPRAPTACSATAALPPHTHPSTPAVAREQMKFLVFDTAADAILAALPASAAEDAVVSLGVSLLSGAIAGTLAAIISQPADVVLSRVAKGEGSAQLVGKLPGSVNQLALIRQSAVLIQRELGFSGFYLGLPSRCLWSGAIIGGQFFLYDLFKQALHLTANDLTQFYDAFGASAAFAAASAAGSASVAVAGASAAAALGGM